MAAKKSDIPMKTVTLFRDNKRYTSDVFVGVNGRTWQIQRGVPVTVPCYVAEVLENSMRQDIAAMEYVENNRVQD